MPRFVLLAVLDNIVGSLVRFFGARTIGPVPDELKEKLTCMEPALRNDLIAMSLVHRSWTSLAQRILFHRVNWEIGHFPGSCLTAKVCTWVRIAHIELSISSSSYLSLLHSLLNMDDLRLLSLSVFDLPAEMFDSVIFFIAQSTRLQGLMLRFLRIPKGVIPFNQLCQILSGLPNLTFFYYKDSFHYEYSYRVHGDEDLPLSEVLSAASPPASLKTVYIDMHVCWVHSCRSHIQWLVRPRNAYALENLYYFKGAYAVLQLPIPSLRSLLIHGVDLANGPTLLSACKDLRILSCDLTPNISPPATLEELHLFKHALMWLDWLDHSILSACQRPSLREVSLAGTDIDPEIYHYFPSYFPRTKEYCATRGIRADWCICYEGRVNS